MSHAVHAKNLSEWVNVQNAKDGFQVAFPRKPIEMSFDLPFQNTPAKGNLHIYSVPLDSGVVMMTVLESQGVKENILKEGQFKDCVDTYLVKYLFQDPQAFHQKQTFKSKKTKHNGLDLMTFQFSYRDGNKTQLMKGAAFLKDGVLYKLVYLAPKEGYDNELLEHFVDSFKLN